MAMLRPTLTPRPVMTAQMVRCDRHTGRRVAALRQQRRRRRHTGSHRPHKPERGLAWRCVATATGAAVLLLTTVLLLRADGSYGMTDALEDATKSLARLEDDDVYQRPLMAPGLVRTPSRLPSLKSPVDYLIDPTPKPAAGLSVEDDGNPSSQHDKYTGGVLVTLFNTNKPTLRARDLREIGMAVHEAGAKDRIPLNEHTHCYCRVGAPKTICICKYLLQPEDLKALSSLWRSADLAKLAEMDMKRQSAKNLARRQEEMMKRRAAAKQNTALVLARQKERRDATEDLRSRRTVAELADMEKFGAKYMAAQLARLQARAAAARRGGGEQVLTPRELLVQQLKDISSKIRDTTSAVVAINDETVARVEEYERVNHDIEVDTHSADQDTAYLATKVRERALKALDALRSGTANQTEVLEQMDVSTRPVVIKWLAHRQKMSLDEQAQKAKDKIAEESQKSEEASKRLGSMRAQSLADLEARDAGWRMHNGIHGRIAEELRKMQSKLSEEMQKRMGSLDKFGANQKRMSEEATKLDEELQKRLDASRREIEEQEEKRKRASEEAAKRRAAGLSQSHGGPGVDVAAELRRLQDMRKKMQVGREELEKEVHRRWARGPVGNGGDGSCVLCKSEEEIAKLEEEVKRLKYELQQCKAHPQQYQAGCEEDLVFQITRLQQEIDRRRGLLAQEADRLEQERQKVSAKLAKCRSEPGGCDQQVEHAMELQLKNAEEEIANRKRKESERNSGVIYKCLYENAASLGGASVAEWFDMPKANMAAGCAKLQSSGPQFAAARKCICTSFDAQSKVLAEAENRLKEMQATSAVQDATTEHRQKVEEKRREQDKAATTGVLKDLLFDSLKSSPNFGELLKKAKERIVREDGADGLHRRLEELTKKNLAQQKQMDGCSAAKGSAAGTKQDGSDSGSIADCAKLSQQPKMPVEKLDACLKDTGSEAVAENLRRAFSVGNMATGCALLSLASNPMLQRIHTCACGSGASPVRSGASGN